MTHQQVIEVDLALRFSTKLDILSNMSNSYLLQAILNESVLHGRFLYQCFDLSSIDLPCSTVAWYRYRLEMRHSYTAKLWWPAYFLARSLIASQGQSCPNSKVVFWVSLLCS